MSEARFDVEALLQKCEELAARFEYDVAIKFCQRILEQDAANSEAHALLVHIFVDSGRVEEARQALTHWLALKDVGEEVVIQRWLFVAQLGEGREAVKAYEHAIALLKGRELCSVHCAIAELFLTDLCFEDDAEEQCEVHLQAALAISPEDAEALQLLASTRLSQSRPEEASTLLARSLVSWKELALTDEAYPTYDFRLSAARLCLELQMQEEADRILEQLVLEDDELCEPWYLLALVRFQLKKQDADEALERAEQLLEAEEESSELSEAIAELRAAIGECSASSTDDDEAEEDKQMTDC